MILSRETGHKAAEVEEAAEAVKEEVSVAPDVEVKLQEAVK